MITIKFIEDKFKKFNDDYFDGSLKTPTFKITHVKSYLGQYTYRYDLCGVLVKSTIKISDMFDRNEEDYCNTIIHEMIHLYIRQNKIRDTRPHHGKVFNSIAERINRQGGWHISRTDSVEGCGLTNKQNCKEYYISCFRVNNNDKYFCFGINKNYIDYYLNKIELYPNFYVDAFIFKSTNDKEFATLPECRKSVRGRYISQYKFNEYRDNESILHNFQTLKIK